MTQPSFLIRLRSGAGTGRWIRRAGTALWWGGGLVSCNPVGPDYRTPEVEVPERFTAGGVEWRRAAWTESAPEPERWWELFGDPDLDALQEAAGAGNLSLEAAAARVDQSRALAAGFYTELFPAIDFAPQAERTQRRFRFDGPATDVVTLDAFQVPFDLSYEVDLWGRVRRQIEGAEAEVDAAVAELGGVRLAVQAEVALNHFALVQLDTEREILRQTLELRRRALGLLGDRLRAGAGAELDVSRAQTEVATAEAELLGLDGQRASLVHAQAVLCGRLPERWEAPERPGVPEPPAVPPSLPSLLLERRPDIAAAERRVAAANARIGAAQAAFFPALTLDANIGFLSDEVGDLFDPDNLVWGLGPKLTLPLSGQGLRVAQLQRSAAVYRESVALYREQVLTAFREAEDALASLAALERQSAAQAVGLEAARRTLELSAARFRAGRVDFFEVVDAERTLLQTRLSANAVSGQRLATTVRLLKALGGDLP